MTHPDCVLQRALDGHAPQELVASVQACARCGGAATCLRSAQPPVLDANAKLLLFSQALDSAQRETAELGGAKSMFLSNMSHEVRTPMNAVMGMSELLLDTPLSSRQQEYAETIRTSAALLMALVDDVLDFSQIEGGELELTRAPFALDDAISGAFALVRSAAASKALDLALELRPGSPTHLVGDLQRLQQILSKLLSNAVKFTPRGEVSLRVEPVEAAAPGELGEVAFTVRDTGIGIAPERIEQLFVAFTQADASSTRSYGGTGLGLSIAKRLVELMQGTLSVESAVGVGSAFRFTIRAEIGRAPQLEYDAAVLRGRRVLIVDDNETNREILLRMTESWDMRPRCAHSGIEALEQLTSEEPFELALFDHHMGGMDGTLLARTAQRLEGRTQLPIVLLSSAGGAAEPSVEDLFAAVMHKPVHPRQLRRVLIELLGRRGHGEEPGAEPDDASGDASGDASPDASGAYAQGGQVAHPLRILVAEDNATNSRVLELLLEQHGYEPDMVSDGHAAVEMALVKRYDLIFMDVKMPKLDGLKAMRAISHALAKIGRPRMVALTAGTGAAERNACLAAGADEFLAKPIDKQRLVAALERCVPLVPPVGGSDSHAAQQAEAAPPASLSVLVAEDNAINQKVIAMLLERLGHRCLIVNNGQEAIDVAAKGGFDLVLMDCHMPVLDGYATTRALRELPCGETLPIVALTALNRPSDRQRCLDAGMDGYVAKPIETALLVAEIAAARAARQGAEVEMWSLDTLAQLRELVQEQPAFADEVLALYRSDSTRLLGQLRAALGRRDAEVVGQLSHELIGASHSVGAQRVAARTKLLCEHAEQGNFEHTPRGLESIAAAVEDSLAGFSAAVAGSA